jgi:uridine kinase
MAGPYHIIGVAGGSASGKTSFLRDLESQLPKGSVSFVSQDNYYFPKEMQHVDENGEINFDLPTSIDRKQFYQDLLDLSSGKSITKTEYTFNNKAVEPKKIVIEPAPIIILEGLFIFYFKEIREMLDLRVFLDVREDTKLSRRIKRDAAERGYPEETVRYQWDNHVTPSYKAYLRPFRDDANIIITNNYTFDKGLKVFADHLNMVLMKDRKGSYFT